MSKYVYFPPIFAVLSPFFLSFLVVTGEYHSPLSPFLPAQRSDPDPPEFPVLLSRSRNVLARRTASHDFYSLSSNNVHCVGYHPTNSDGIFSAAARLSLTGDTIAVHFSVHFVCILCRHPFLLFPCNSIAHPSPHFLSCYCVLFISTEDIDLSVLEDFGDLGSYFGVGYRCCRIISFRQHQ